MNNNNNNNIVSGCPELAETEYIHRHNKVAVYLHWKICWYYNIKTTDKWYDHDPTIVTERHEVTILWDMSIHTDRGINANRPDIVIKDKQERGCKVIAVSISSDNNASVKVAEKLSKYKDLVIEISGMWDLKTDTSHTTPVVIETLGLVIKGQGRYTNNIPGNINIFEIQKIAILGTAHILLRVLLIK